MLHPTQRLRLASLHVELLAVGRDEDAAALLAALVCQSSVSPVAADAEDRKRRQARERQQRARDRRMSRDTSRTERDEVRDASRFERDELRDGERDASRVTQRDADSAITTIATLQRVAEAPLSNVPAMPTQRDASRAERDVCVTRHAMGGKGGAVFAVAVSELPATTTPTNHTARERDVTRDASRSVTLHRDTHSRPVASTMLPALPTTHAKLDVLQQRTTSAITLRRAAAELVYRYWAAKLGKANALLSADRERRIVERLRENGDNASELCWAIDGLTRSAFHMGRNDANTKHDDITVVCRDRVQVEKFASACPQWAAREDHPFVRDARAELLASTASPMPLFQEVSNG